MPSDAAIDPMSGADCRDPVLGGFLRILGAEARLSEQLEFLKHTAPLKLSGHQLAGMARILLSRCVPVRGIGDGAIDLCGTGGDQRGTFNISTVASFVVAGAGIRVAKHGNRSVSSQSGSTDCLERLGVAASLQPEQIGQLIHEVGIAFMFAPLFHPVLARVMKARRMLSAKGTRTVFNVLGPLVNPAFVRRRTVGVFDDGLIEPVAQSLQLLGVHKALVVHGDGLDEITLSGETHYARVDGDDIFHGTLAPELFGFERCSRGDLAGGSPSLNARLARAILDGDLSGSARDIVVLNAAAGIYVGSGFENDLHTCVTEAAASLDSGSAMKTLDLLIRNTQRCRMS